jgi:hypothetical protein
MFKGWSIGGVDPDSGCDGSGDPECSFTITEHATVTALFADRRLVHLTVDRSLISIEFHNAGQPAQSNESTLTLDPSFGEPVQLCVASFKSFTGNSIEDITSVRL